MRKVKKHRKKKNKQNYTRWSSHKDIGSLCLFFALRITKANFFLK